MKLACKRTNQSPAKSGRKDPEVLAGLLDAATAWMIERA